MGYNLTTEMRQEGVSLFYEDEEIGIIKYEGGLWVITIENNTSSIKFRSLEAAQYFALAIFIESRWAAEEATL